MLHKLYRDMFTDISSVFGFINFTLITIILFQIGVYMLSYKSKLQIILVANILFSNCQTKYAKYEYSCNKVIESVLDFKECLLIYQNDFV